MAENQTIRKCLCCGTEYRYCYRCDGANIYNSWKNNFHDENCRRVFNTVANFNAGSISEAEAKKVLDDSDLTFKNSFAAPIKDGIQKIYMVSKMTSNKHQKRR